MPGRIWLVLHLDAKKRGSMEQQLVALASRLRDAGVALTYVFARPPAAFPGEELRDLGVDVRALDFSRPAQAAARLAGWLHESRPQIVHFHFVDAYSPLVLAAKLSGAKVAVHDHLCIATDGGLRAQLKRVRGALLNRAVDLRVAVSQFAARTVAEAHGVPRERIRVVENGIDLGRFDGVDGSSIRRELDLGDAPLLACVARLDEQKGGESLIRAMPQVHRGAHLALVGEGPCAPAWRELAAQLGVARQVHFMGLRNDVERVLAAASIVVVPTHCEEAFGLAAIEAMAANRPVIVSQSGEMPAMVGDGGLVVPQRDPAALHAAVNRLLDDPLLARRLGREGRVRAERLYGIDRYVDRMVEVYRELGQPCDPEQSRLAA